METKNETSNKKEKLEPKIVYKEIHGKILPVKIYPTLPNTDTFDQYTSDAKGAGPQDYRYRSEVVQAMNLEFVAKLAS